MTPPADEPSRTRRSLAVASVVCVAVLAESAAFAITYWAHYVRHIGYDLFALSDTYLYFRYAVRMAAGLRAFFDFRVEYPPLALPIFALPSTAHGLLGYQLGFASVMAVVCVATAVATSLTDLVGRWKTREAYAVGVVFALLVLATGAILVNRYDAVVALVFACTLLAISLGWWEVAGLVLGIGFALKLTPIFLLPLPLILAPRRRALWAFGAFLVAAAAPFVPYLLGGAKPTSALVATFTYHQHRPLEVESLLSTPLLLAHHVARMPLAVEYTFGSHNVVARGAIALAALSTPLVAGCLALVYWAVWRRRKALLADNRLVALAMLAALLGSMLFTKVLSPQYVVWLLPATALVAVDRKVLAITVAAAMLLTQWLFPPLYPSLVHSDSAAAFAVLALRNAVLVVAFVLAIVALRRLPTNVDASGAASTGTHP